MMFRLYLPRLGRPARMSCLVLLAALVALLFATDTLHAAPATQSGDVIAGSTLEGSLSADGARHYLTVEPTSRDGFIILTLAFEPLNTDLQGQVNFLVLDDDQLRRFIAGDIGLRDENIASGARLQFDPVGNKVRASFQDSGRGEYAVIVYNNADEPITYTLDAIGGVLSDRLSQTTLPEGAENLAATATDTSDPLADAATATSASAGYAAVRANTVTGELEQPITRHYIDVDPTIRDGTIDLKLTYAPDIEALEGFVNFVVLDEHGVRRLLRGDPVFDLELATGAPIPFNDAVNELVAQFRASGDGPYTAVVYNGAAEPASYEFAAQGAELVDFYGQTNESQASPVGVGAQPVAPSPLPDVTEGAAAAVSTTGDVVEEAEDDSGLVFITGEEAAATGSTRAMVMNGLLDQPYEHHYYGLFPTVRDSRVTVTLDYDPRTEALRDKVNFWVVDEDGLRRIIAGARPEDVEIASGASVPFGIDKGKLRAVFNASARGEYTVIVHNDSEDAAIYSLQSRGGELEDLSAQAAALGTLP